MREDQEGPDAAVVGMFAVIGYRPRVSHTTAAREATGGHQVVRGYTRTASQPREAPTARWAHRCTALQC